MTKNNYLFLLIFISFFKGAWAADLPPIGKRIYIIDKDNPFNPSVIKTRKAQTDIEYLKDPIQYDGTTGYLPDLSKYRPVIGKKPKILPAKLNFKPLLVKGKYSQPRIAFSQKELPVE